MLTDIFVTPGLLPIEYENNPYLVETVREAVSVARATPGVDDIHLDDVAGDGALVDTDVRFHGNLVGGGAGRHLLINANVTFVGGLISGGGLVLHDGTTRLQGTLLENNDGGNDGGAINVTSNARLLSFGAEFVGNTALDGGAVHVREGGVAWFGDGTSFEGNSASYRGGALSVRGKATVSGSFFYGNEADRGGAIHVAGGEVTVTGSQVGFATLSGSTLGNRADYGGAIFGIGDDTLIKLKGTQVEGNTAAVSGGGVHLEDGVLRTRLAGGSGTDFADNTADGFGGAIFAEDAVLNIADAIISDNTAEFGGGLAVTETRTFVTRTLVAGNLADVGGGLHQVGGYSFLSDTGLEANRLDLFGDTFTALSQGGGMHLTDGAIVKTRRVGIADHVGLQGGGIWMDDSRLTFEEGLIGYNEAGIADRNFWSGTLTHRKGGGIYARNSQVTIARTEAYSNVGYDGGGLIAVEDDATVMRSRVVLRELEATDHAGFRVSGVVPGSDRGNGGVVYFAGPIGNANGSNRGSLAINGGTYSTSGATSGGVVYAEDIDVNVKNAAFSGSTATDDGGAFFVEDGALSLLDVEIRNMQADRGGAVFHRNSHALFGKRVAITANTATRGGGVYLADSNLPAVRARLVDSVIAGNAASGTGGGLYLEGGTSLELDNPTDTTGNSPNLKAGAGTLV